MSTKSRISCQFLFIDFDLLMMYSFSFFPTNHLIKRVQDQENAEGQCF